MALVALVLIALISGLAVAGFAAHRSRAGGAAIVPSDPEPAAGLALAVALAVLVAGGVVLAVLTFVIRSDPDAIGLDTGAANWGARHATPFTTDVLDAITFVGLPRSIAVLAALLAVAETARTRNRWVVPFVLVVVAGNGIITTTIKHLADRVRPAINPIAETLGPSFPSGHSSWSAAFFAAAALLLARHRGRRARIVLAGTAAGAAVAIAATRVLLGVHWFSDVVAGLALGWAWFAVCAIAFDRRVFTARPAVRDARPAHPRRAAARVR